MLERRKKETFADVFALSPLFPSQNIMPISAAMFRSERNNPVPQCPPRLDVQMLTPVIWSRMPNRFLNPDVGRVSERLGWVVECTEPLIMMALHIPEENRSVKVSSTSARPDSSTQFASVFLPQVY